MATLSPEELTGVKEDLTIHKVMLDSMQGDDFQGTEEEREEVRKEIARLRSILRDAANAMQKSNESQESSQTLGVEDHIRDSQDPETPMSRHSPTMAPASSQGTDIWTPNGSHSLPRRKRDASSVSENVKEEASKSRRSTPTPHRQQSISNDNWNSQNMTFIDLTGDDADLDAAFIADQIKIEQRQKQENEDRKLAEYLSSQGSGTATPNGASSGPSSTAGPSSTDALTRLMQTQQANSAAPSSTQDTPDVIEIEYPMGPAPPLNMPGSYDSRWDAPNTGQPFPQRPMPPARPAHYEAPVNNYSWRPKMVPGSFSSSAEIMRQHMAQQRNAAFQSTQPMQTPLSSTVGPASQFPRFAQPGTAGNPLTLNDMRRGSDGLSSIINRTSMFADPNFDSSGYQMPERLSNFLESAYHDPRVSEKELDDLLLNIRPDMEIPEAERGNSPAGLKNSLYYHQQLALTWMKKMEAGTNKGGILADDMGLGKTISMLALMLENKATSRPKTNLIIGPLSLIRQWEEEIKTKTNASHRLSVFIHHGRKTTTDELLKYDAVLTTYGTIAAELKRLETFQEENADRNIDYNDRTTAMKFPLLHPTKAIFYRVVLDEAQCIKNKRTQTSLACHKLRATYRWCLTGTPMMNGVPELYPYLRFLRIKPYNDSQKFTQAFGVLFGKRGDPKHVAMNRLRALLKAIMLRRKKNSELDGKPILRLPPKTEEVVYAELSPDERDFYNQLEKRSQVLFSKYLRQGSVGKNYSSILVLLLRLRQACCHPHLNLDVNDTNPVTEEDMLESAKNLDSAIVARIKAIEAFECPICYDAVPCPSFFVPCGHDSCNQCISQLADNAAALNIQEGNESDKAKCPVCREPFDPRKCFTYDIFQKIFMQDALKKEEADDDKIKEENDTNDSSDDSSDESSDEASDEINGQGNLKGFVVNDSEEEDVKIKPDDKDDIKPKKVKKSKKAKGKGKEKAKKLDVKPSMLKQLRKDAAKNREAYKRYMTYLRATWMPAAKVSECIKLLKEIEETGEKTIIFSQWTLLLDLIEIAMEHEDFAHKPKRYDGGMSGELRSAAAREFRDKKDVKVMLVSLRAGNAGLNLTSATRVIIMDPFWNPYIEMQAVDRAYRIGQQNEVKVYRILTKETVEDRIVDLKQKKQDMVESALDESESAKIGRLNVNELRFLFNSSN